MFVPKNNSIPRPVTADERTSDFDLLEVLLNLLSDPVVKNPHRKLIVLTSLVTVLTVTSALLLALAPPPLAAQTPYDSLSAEDSVGNASDLIDAIFNTRVPARPERWKYIYVHQTDTVTGNTFTLASAPGGLGDHFVIGNGHGCPDGQIQMSQRWINQAAAGAPAGAERIDPACISIAIVGNFNVASPTANQIHRLVQHVSALQSQLGIGADKVVVVNGVAGPAGTGKLFPEDYLRQQILP